MTCAVNVRAIRERTGLSQGQFAARFGLSASNVKNWEQGRREPDQAALVLLLVIDQHPELVAAVVRGSD